MMRLRTVLFSMSLHRAPESCGHLEMEMMILDHFRHTQFLVYALHGWTF